MSTDDFLGLLAKNKPGDDVKLKINRENMEQDLKVTLGIRPGTKGGKSRGDTQNNMGSKLSDRRAGFPIILQHDSVIKPHECGGPLVNLEGQVLGINIARAGRTESYAIPSEAVRPLLGKAEDEEKIRGRQMKKLLLGASNDRHPQAAFTLALRPQSTTRIKFRIKLVDAENGKGIAGIVHVSGTEKYVELPGLFDRMTGLTKDMPGIHWYIVPADGAETSLPRGKWTVKALSGLETGICRTNDSIWKTRNTGDAQVADPCFARKKWAGSPGIHICT